MKICFIIFYIIIIVGCNNDVKQQTHKAVPEVTEIEKIKITDLDGKAVSLEQYKGKAVFINFWGTWCKPCILEMPSIETAQANLSKENIIFLMASSEPVEDIKQFSNNVSYKFNYVRINNSEEMNIEALPVTHIYDAKGKLVFAESGMRKWDDKNNINMLQKIINQK